jgi:predicted PurR-regulated permease PerM
VQHPNVSATISVVLIALVVMLPVTLLGRQLLAELSAGIVAVQDQIASGDLQRTLQSYPMLVDVISVIEGWLDARAIVGNVASTITDLGGAFVRESLSHLTTALLTFYLLYYFLRDRRDAQRQIRPTFH